MNAKHHGLSVIVIIIVNDIPNVHSLSLDLLSMRVLPARRGREEERVRGHVRASV
jgi:hypothetical protein